MTPATVPALQRRNAQLEAKIEQLKEENADLKRRVNLVANTEAEMTLQAAFHLPPLDARYLYLLYLRRGRPLTTDAALDALYPHEADRPEDKITNVLVCRLRDVIGFDNIVTLRGVGYYLTADMISRIDALLDVAKPEPVYKVSTVDAMPPRQPSDSQVKLRAMMAFAKGQMTSLRLAALLEWQTHRACALISRLLSDGLIERTDLKIANRKVYRLSDAGRAWVAARRGAE